MGRPTDQPQERKQRPSVIERARMYVEAMPAGISGSGRHNATVAVANVLLNGFGLTEADAWALLSAYNERCQPPNSEQKLKHRFNLAKHFVNDNKATHWLREAGAEYGVSQGKPAKVKVFTPAPKPAFEVGALRSFAGEWAGAVDLIWLANRSAIDPATLDTAGYLRALYEAHEHVVVFDNEYSQGCALWPVDEAKLPAAGKNGCWYLAQPTDGKYHPNPRSLDKEGKPKMSRRSEESVTAWRYLVIESDEAPLNLWLGALVKLPLRIAAIYTSGGRSIHALVRVDARTKEHWDAIKSDCFGPSAPAGRFLIRNGADKGVLSAVRLTRLPGCYRQGKFVDEPDGSQRYLRFPEPALQKLLYINPNPDVTPLADLLAKRDVEQYWLQMAGCGSGDADDTGGRWLFAGLSHYATRSAAIAKALEGLHAQPV